MAGRKPGTPKTGGRKPGVKNKRTEEVIEAQKDAAEQLAEVLPGCFEGDSHALLMAIYKDVARPIELRLDAAKAAIGYEKNRLAAVQVTGDPEHPLTVTHIEIVAPK